MLADLNAKSWLKLLTTLIRDYYRAPSESRHEVICKCFVSILQGDAAALFIPADDNDSQRQFTLVGKSAVAADQPLIWSTSKTTPPIIESKIDKPTIRDLRRSPTPAILLPELVADRHPLLVLEIPLIDRHNVHFGVVRVYYYTSPLRDEDEEVARYIAAILSVQTVLLLKTTRTIQIIARLASPIPTNTQNEQDRVYALLCDTIRDLLRAKHVFLFLPLQEGTQEKFGLAYPAGAVCDFVEQDHLIAIVQETCSNHSQIVRHVVHSSGRQLLTMSVGDSECLGVVIATGQPQHTFDDFDVDLFRLLHHPITNACRQAKRDRSLRDVFLTLSHQRQHPNVVFNGVLDVARKIWGFENCLLYWVDRTEPERVVLRPLAFCGRTLEKDINSFSFPVTETAAATHVYRTGQPFYCDQAAGRKDVSARGREFFHIDPDVPIVSVPVGLPSTLVGVFVAWGKGVRPEHKTELGQFGLLAACGIAFHTFKRYRDIILERCPSILELLKKAASDKEIFHEILLAAKAADFDRARLFAMSDDRTQMVPLESLDENNASDEIASSVSVTSNPYLRFTLDHVHAPRTFDPQAKPEEKTGCFGIDPDAQKLGKPNDLPWVVVPLRLGLELAGQIVADNRQTRREIAEDQVACLGMLGAIAALVLARRRSQHLIVTSNVESAFRVVRAAENIDDLWQRLAYACVCVDGLGASRAICYSAIPSRQELRFVGGYGTTGPDEHEKYTRQSRRDGLKELASSGKLPAYSFAPHEDAVPTLSYAEVQELFDENVTVELVDPRQKTVPWFSKITMFDIEYPLLIALVKSETQLLGVILCDFAWQGIGLEAAVQSIATLCRRIESIVPQIESAAYEFVRQHVGNDNYCELARHPELLSTIAHGQELEAFVVSVDLRRSTQLMLQTVSAEGFTRFVSQLVRALQEQILAHYGIYEKFTGDGVLAVFPLAYSGAENAGRNAILAAAACHRCFSQVYQECRDSFRVVYGNAGLGIGVDFGPVTFTEMFGRLTVIGEPVVYACRLGGSPAGHTYLNHQARCKLRDIDPYCTFKPVEVEVKHEGIILAYDVELRDDTASSLKVCQPGWKIGRR